MLILPERELKRKNRETKKGLVNEFNRQLEDILNQYQHIDRYWVLGKLRFPKEYNGSVGKIFLEACLEKPPLITEAFLYEVDNRKGNKTLLWVTHPDGTLSMPTLDIAINTGVNHSVAANKGRRHKRA